MSKPLGRIDIMHCKQIGDDIKIGELTLNEDNSLEGFLFENETIRRIIAYMPNTVSLELIIHPARPAAEEISNGG